MIPFFLMNLWNNNNKFIHLLTIHSYLRTLLCTCMYMYIHKMCIYFNIYITWYMLVTKFEPWSKYLNANALFQIATTRLCNIMCQITNIKCFPQIILQIKIFTCIFFSVFVQMKKMKMNSWMIFKDLHIKINKHTQIQFMWRNILFYFVIKQLKKKIQNFFFFITWFILAYPPTNYIHTNFLFTYLKPTYNLDTYLLSPILTN